MKTNNVKYKISVDSGGGLFLLKKKERKKDHVVEGQVVKGYDPSRDVGFSVRGSSV